MLTIGLAGGTGSGKTTVVSNIMQQLNADIVNVISQDNYYLDNSHLSFEEREKLNYDHPKSIDFELLINHIERLKKGESIQQPIYSFATHIRTKDSVLISPQDVCIVEGILVLTQSNLRKLFDVKIYVNADSDERLIRRIRRDIQERGRTLEEVLQRYQSTLKPMHEQFIAPSMAYADIIVPNMKKNIAAIEVLTSLIQNNLNKIK